VSLVRKVLGRLLEHDLYVKAEKCEFSKRAVSFLGYRISTLGVVMECDHVKAVRNWPTPTTVKEVQRFLGFANYYRRFIRGFGQVAAPITSLLKGRPVRLQWSADVNRAFLRLKALFTDAPVLAHPDPSLVFIVEVDASEAGVGAVLSQRSGSSPKLRPCAFFSKKLGPAEQNYDVEDRYVVKALKVWRHWLEGAKHPFLIWTDLTDLPPSQGNTMILVVVDRFSKSCCLIPLPGLPTALQTVETLFTHVFRHYGVPEDIISDRGPQFTSRVWKAFMECLGVSVSLTSGYYLESNGQVERVNQEVGRFLRSYCQDWPGEWARYVPWAEMAQNSLRHSSTNMSPFQ
jgi:hypothetical protein